MKRILTSLIVLAMLMCMLPSAVFADAAASEEPSYVPTIYNEENGLPTGEANTITQDQKGYLWIGSYGGLIRYDGSKFTNYSSYIEAASVRSLYVAKDGCLYIGTNDHGAYVMRDGEITPVEKNTEHSFLCIRAFTEDKNGVIYVASTTGVARIIDGVLTEFHMDKTDNEQFYSVACDAYGNVWALSDTGDLYIFNEEGLIGNVSSSDIFDSGRVYSLSNDDNGILYFGSSLNEVARMVQDTNAAPDDEGSVEKTIIDLGSVSTVNHLYIAHDGTVVVSALNGFGYINKDLKFIRTDDQNGNSISANWGEKDKQGNLWLASSNYGIIRFSESCIESCNEHSRLGDITVNAVAKAGNTYYLGIDTGILLFDEDWHEIKNEALSSQFAGNRVRNVTIDTQGRIWFATYSEGGAMCYDPKTKTVTGFGESKGLNSNIVRVVYALSDGSVLVGNQSGVNIIKDGKIIKSYGIEDGMDTTSILCAMELNGKIYVGSDGSGIYELTDNGLVSHYTEEGLWLGVILRMTPDSDMNGNYYICAGSNLFYYEADKGEFRELTGINFGSGSLYSVYDKDGYIWVLQNAGIFAAKKEDVLAGNAVYTKVYGKEHGLTGTLNANTWNWLDEDGSIYLPTRNGVSHFSFKGLDLAMPAPEVNYITVDDVQYDNPKELSIPSNVQRLSFDVSSMNFCDTVEYELAVQLEGFDPAEFVTYDKSVNVSYTNLPGGDYNLKYYMKDPVTGETTLIHTVPIHKEIKVTERPIFWFGLAIGVLTLVVLFFLYLMKVRQDRAIARQKELEAITDQALKTITQTIDAKDEYTQGHSVRVATYAREIARRLGATPGEQDRIYKVGLLHDIGKIGVPDQVLNKKGKLTDEEYQLIRSHPLIGGKILEQFTAIPGIGEGAMYHHERWDGKGYCKGLKGEEIPYFARIISVADSYDAMESNRVYRKGITTEVILNELKNGAGTQFDPNIVPVMVEMIEDGFAPIDYDGTTFE